MRSHLKIFCLQILCVIQVLECFCLQAQSISFNKRIHLVNRATIIRDIVIKEDTLLLSGETGIDSTGYAGIFLLEMDTLGNIIDFQAFHEPELSDDMLQEGREPMLM